MQQQFIRKYEGDSFSIQEGAEIVEELDKRTKSSQTGYNSIDELATKVKSLDEEFNYQNVKYTAQNATEAQKIQAQKNIGVDNFPDPFAAYINARN